MKKFYNHKKKLQKDLVKQNLAVLDNMKNKFNTRNSKNHYDFNEISVINNINQDSQFE